MITAPATIPALPAATAAGLLALAGRSATTLVTRHRRPR